MHRLLISAAHKSSGKTTLALGMCAVLSESGRVVQPFKKGPDYIDPSWLAVAAGRRCVNLDFYTMADDEIEDAFTQHSHGADVALIEGNKGLYDGLALDGSNSNAALARLLRTPVLLVIDARGMTRGIAPLILGYQAFERDIEIGGVILNKLGGQRHESKLRAVIEHYTDVPVLGAVYRHPELEISERHLGLMPSNEDSGARGRIRAIAAHVRDEIDLDSVLGIARRSATVGAPHSSPAGRAADVRIGVPRDAAFGFYYPDDLDALAGHGADIVYFDTLRDEHLPSVDGLFIGGGFPEMHMEALAANTRLRAQIRRFVLDGYPVYAECGGLMYLARSIDWAGQRRSMVGAIPVDCTMWERPQGRGYVSLRETPHALWPAADRRADGEIPAHEFHYSRIDNVGEGIEFAYDVVRGTGIDGRHDGIVFGNTLACYAHQRHVRRNPWTARFLEHVRACRRQRRGQADIGRSRASVGAA